jgi:precorrin-6B methylase 2
MNRLYKNLKLLFYPKNVFWKLIQLRWRGMLYEEGWFESACFYKSINKNQGPIPWWSYSFNDFFIPKLNKDIKVFEYGSGNSTLFLESRVKNIKSVEHDKTWYNKMKQNLKNAQLIYKDLEDKYEEIILEMNDNFDLIIIDGRKRVKCIKNSIHKLNYNGVIILDDSQRDYYKEGIKFLENNGFKHIYFSGVSAGTYRKKYTSIFYRQNNWIGL